MGDKKPELGAVIIVRQLINGEPYIALSLRKDITWRKYPRHWQFPGGTVEPEEEPSLAAVRELKEETGLKVEVSDLREFGVFDRIGNNDKPYREYYYTLSLPLNQRMVNTEPLMSTPWVFVPLLQPGALESYMPGIPEVMTKYAHYWLDTEEGKAFLKAKYVNHPF